MVGPGWFVHIVLAVAAVHDSPVMLHVPTSAVHCAFVVQAIELSKLHEPLSGVQSPATEHAAPLDALFEQVFPMLQSLAMLHDVVFGCPAVQCPGAPPQVVPWFATVHDAPLFAPPVQTPVESAHCGVEPTAVHEAPTAPLVHAPGLAQAASALAAAPVVEQVVPTFPVEQAPFFLQATSVLAATPVVVQAVPMEPVVQAPAFEHCAVEPAAVHVLVVSPVVH